MKGSRRVLSWVGCLCMAAVLAACGSTGGAKRDMVGENIPAADLEILSKQQFVNADGEAARSEALFQSLLRKLPSDADTWFRLGNLYASNNRPDAAASAYGRALMADNAHARAWHNLAVIRLRQGYAALIQAQMSGDPADEGFAKRIDGLIDELSRVSALAEEKKPPPRAAGDAPAAPAPEKKP